MTDARGERRPLIEPRGLSRADAAGYVGVSPTLFGQLVDAGVMPPPKMMRGRFVWDRRELDRAFDDLPERNSSREDRAGADDGWLDARA